MSIVNAKNFITNFGKEMYTGLVEFRFVMLLTIITLCKIMF